MIRTVGSQIKLVPSSQWNFEGGSWDDDSWQVRATCYGPSSSTTFYVPQSGVVFVTWGASPGQRYVGLPATSWASGSARLASETERALADESAGPIGNFISTPADGGDGTDSDPLKMLKADIARSRGKAFLVESMQVSWEDGSPGLPASNDWRPNRLGPGYDQPQVQAAQDGFLRTLALLGIPPSLFVDSDGTGQREGLRRYHLGLVRPLAQILQHELSRKLETPIRLEFDSYPMDTAGRAGTVAKLVGAGVEVERALQIAGL